MRFPTLFAALSVLVAASPVARSSPRQGGPPPASVVVDEVLQDTVQRRVRVIGSLRARATATLAALEEGPLVELDPREAARVGAGEVVARTDTRRLDADRAEVAARIEEARAGVTAKEAELANRRTDLAALEAAAQQNAVSQRDLRNARTAVDTGVAELAAARQMEVALRAALARIDVRLQDATVAAPFDAVVVARHAEPGEWVKPGDPLLTLQSTGRVEGWLNVPERYAGELRLDAAGSHAELVARPGAREVLRLRWLPQVDPRARTFAVIADLDDEGGALTPGMSVTAWLPLGEPAPELLVPKDALVRRDLSVVVHRVVSGEGAARAEPVPVTVRFELARHVAVEPGALHAGDRVVVEGNERLLPGAPVVTRPVGAEATGREAAAGANGAAPVDGAAAEGGS